MQDFTRNHSHWYNGDSTLDGTPGGVRIGQMVVITRVLILKPDIYSITSAVRNDVEVLSDTDPKVSDARQRSTGIRGCRRSTR